MRFYVKEQETLLKLQTSQDSFMYFPLGSHRKKDDDSYGRLFSYAVGQCYESIITQFFPPKKINYYSSKAIVASASLEKTLFISSWQNFTGNTKSLIHSFISMNVFVYLVLHSVFYDHIHLQCTYTTNCLFHQISLYKLQQFLRY